MEQFTSLSVAAIGIAAFSFASLPEASAEPTAIDQGSASDLGVMSIQLKDIVKPQLGIQGTARRSRCQFMPQKSIGAGGSWSGVVGVTMNWMQDP